MCRWNTLYGKQIVVLVDMYKRGGFWIAEDSFGEKVCPDADRLEPMELSVAPAWARVTAGKYQKGGNDNGREVKEVSID